MSYTDRAFDTAARAAGTAGMGRYPGDTEPHPDQLHNVALLVAETATLANHAALVDGDTDAYYAVQAATAALTWLTAWIQADTDGQYAARNLYSDIMAYEF